MLPVLCQVVQRQELVVYSVVLVDVDAVEEAVRKVLEVRSEDAVEESKFPRDQAKLSESSSLFCSCLLDDQLLGDSQFLELMICMSCIR